MHSGDLFEQVRKFRSNNLKKVATQVTTEGGHQFVETLVDDGTYSVSTRIDNCNGYVLDSNVDITIALVVPGLILGSQDVAMELKILQDFNVTHILNVGYKIPNYFDSKFVYKNVDILDMPTSNIRTFFEGCFQFIDDGRQEGCVLVHCNAGVSRAPTIIIAYLMRNNHLRLNEAFALVKSVRSFIRPNDGFLKILKDYDKDLFDKTDKEK